MFVAFVRCILSISFSSTARDFRSLPSFRSFLRSAFDNLIQSPLGLSFFFPFLQFFVGFDLLAAETSSSGLVVVEIVV